MLVVVHHSFSAAAKDLLTRLGFEPIGNAVSYTTMSGVELFFVLSGIVLLRRYVRNQRPLVVSEYLRRRVERLWPPYLAALVLAGVVVYVAGLHSTWYSREVLPEFTVTGWIAHLGIVNFGWPLYNNAWWSLSLEIVFYLLAPVFVWLLMAARSRLTSVLVLAVLCLLAALSLLFAGASSINVAELFVLYLPCFIAGVLIARYEVAPRIGALIAGVGLSFVLLSLAYPGLNIHLGFAALYGGIVVVAMEGQGRLRSALASRPLVWIGERSYSLFLVHFSVFYAVNYLLSLVLPDRSGTYFLVSRALGLPLALFTAMVLFFFVERRFARGLTTADQFWPPIRLRDLSRSITGARPGTITEA